MIANIKLLLIAFAINMVIFAIVMMIKYRDEISYYFSRRRALAASRYEIQNQGNDEVVQDAKKINIKDMSKYEERKKLAAETFSDFVKELKKDYPIFPPNPTERMDVYIRMAKKDGSLGGEVCAEGLIESLKDAYSLGKADQKIVAEEIRSVLEKSKFFKKSKKLGDMQMYRIKK